MRLIQHVFCKLLNANIFLLLLGFISIFPFLFLAYFNHPSADDFCYNTASQNLSYLDTQIKLFTNLNGRYTTSAILSIPAFLSHNLFLYKLMPLLLIVVLFYAIYYLASALFLNLGRLDFTVLALVCLSIYLILMPNVSQGFYWLSSSVSYQLSSVFVILLFSSVVRLLYSNKIKHVIISVILLTLIIGANEIAMIITDFLILVISLFSFFKTRKINYKLLFLLVVATVLSFVVIQSQGNNLRGDFFPNKQMLFYSIYKTLNILKSYLIIWLPIMIVAILIFYDVFNKKKDIKATKVFNVPPFLALLVSISIIFIGFFVGYWATGNLLPKRAINLIFFFFMLSFIYFTMVAFFNLKKKGKDFIAYSPFVRYFLFLSLIFLIAQKENIKIAYSDLISGRAYKYDFELKKRYQLIRRSQVDTVYISKIENKPKTIFEEDITNNNAHWKNGCYNAYFQKIIILKENENE